ARKVNARVETYLEGFRRENVIPDEADLSEMSWAIDELIKIHISSSPVQLKDFFQELGKELIKDARRNIKIVSQEMELESKLNASISAAITAKGIDEVERTMQSSYAEKEYRVLHQIYDMGGPNHMGWVDIQDLFRELGMDNNEVNEILIDLDERKSLIEGLDQVVKMKPAGIEEIEATMQNPSGATMNFPPYIVNNYTTNIGGHNYGGIQQNTTDSTQTITLISNQPIGEILPKLVELIQAVRQSDFPDKEDAVADLEKAHQLAQGEQSEGKWKRIQAKLNAAKTTMELAGLAYKSLPYW